MSHESGRQGQLTRTTDSPIGLWSPTLAALERRTDYRRALLALLLIATLVGAGLRLWNLGRLSISVDEGFMALAVDGILKRGGPVLDHGHVYSRALPFLYLQAGVAAVVGNTALALRLPAAILGIACIPLAYLFSRRMLGPTVATLVAVMIACSAWEIEMSRYGRFYTALQAAWLIAGIFFHRGFIQDHRSSRVGFFVTVFVGLWFHELMILAGAWLLMILPLRGYTWPRKAVYLVLLGAMPLLRQAVNMMRATLGARWHAAWEAQGPALTVIPSEASPLARTLPIDLPTFARVELLWAAQPAVLAGLLILALLSTVGLLWTVRRGVDWRQAILAALIVTTAAVDQMGLTATAIVAYLAFFVRRVGDLRRPHVLLMAAVVLVAGAVWFLVGLRLEGRPWRHAAAWLFLYPDYGRHFVQWMLSGWPGLSLGLCAGAILVGWRAGRDERGNVAWCTLAMLVLPLMVMGMLRPLWYEARYFFHLYPNVLLVFAPLPVLTAVAIARRLPLLHHPAAISGWAMLVLAATLYVSQDPNLLRSVRIPQREYGWRDPIKQIVSWPLHADYHQDYASTAAYIRELRHPEDQIIVVGPVHTAACMKFLLGQVDYVFGYDWAYTRTVLDEKGRPYDEVANAVVVTQIDDLQQVIERPRSGAVWLISTRRLSQPRNWVVLDPQRTYLRDLTAEPDYVARDGQTLVVRIGPDRMER